MPKGRILAVDDQRYFRELIESLLTEEGFEARTASSGEEALRVLEQSRFDVVVTDLVMPGMDGGELVQRVKERDPDQEIVVVTGVVDVKTAVDAMKLGATDYLLKPFDRRTLALCLEAILERRRLRAEHERLLAENIEYLGERSLFERAIKLYDCLSLEPLAEQIVEDLCLETRAQGGVLWLDPSGEAPRLPLAAAGGLVRLDAEPRELARDALPPELARGSARSLPRDEGGPGRVLLLPLRREGRLLGIVRLADKLGDEAFDAVDRTCAEKFARFAEGALANALRVGDLERRTLADGQTGAYTYEYFQDVVRNEIEKASRFGRGFSLLGLDLGSPEARGADETARRAWLAGLVERLRPLLRATDLLAVRGRERLYAILPEADALGTASLKRRAREALEEQAPGEPAPLHLGAVTYPGDGTQFESLVRALEARIEEDRRSPVRALGLAGRSFSEALAALLEGGSAERPETAEQVVRFVLGDLARRPRERGLCFVSTGGVLDRAAREGLEALAGTPVATEIVVIADGERQAPLTDSTVTWLPPRRVPGLPPCLILLGDGPAYAMARAPALEADAARFFHSDDRSVVEHLAHRLQRELALPERAPLGGEA